MLKRDQEYELAKRWREHGDGDAAHRLNKTQFQYTLNDANPGELEHWSALFLEKIKAFPGIADVTTDQLNAGPLLDITIKRDVASSYGILPYTIDNTLDDAFGQRIVSTIYTTLQQYHVILEVNQNSNMDPRRSAASMSNHRAGNRCRYPRWSIRW